MRRNLLIAALVSLLAGASQAQVETPKVKNPKVQPPLAAPKAVLEPAGTPELLDVTPASGSPSQTVVIRGKNLPMDKFQNEVWFTVAENTPVQAKTIEITKDQDIISYKVQLLPKTGVIHIYSGKVYMKPKDTGKETNSLPFEYIPSGLPTITSTDPARYATYMTLFGSNFKPDDKVYFDTGEYGGYKEVTTKQYVSAGKITVDLPSTMGHGKKVGIYISGKFGNEWASGPKYYIPLPPSNTKQKNDKGNEEATK